MRKGDCDTQGRTMSLSDFIMEQTFKRSGCKRGKKDKEARAENSGLKKSAMAKQTEQTG